MSEPATSGPRPRAADEFDFIGFRSRHLREGCRCEPRRDDCGETVGFVTQASCPLHGANAIDYSADA